MWHIGPPCTLQLTGARAKRFKFLGFLPISAVRNRQVQTSPCQSGLSSWS